ncbi:MAG TPA: hypothetical protein ENL12_02520 [Dehalococcoidia bacterium]|nr:hypothetical protein [Dehalococcoidia bacterium]
MDPFEYVMHWTMLSFLFSGLGSVSSTLVYLYIAFCLYTISSHGVGVIDDLELAGPTRRNQ